ncbi:MAG: sulfatase [Parabacteroides sp.]|nr:sulfatase [Parabacteroides sp.]
MTCRIIVNSIAFSSLLVPVNLYSKEPAKGKSPNIIFILTDDQRWDAIGYAGNTIIQTPEIDRLAREGLYFRNAFSSTPISAASRASILTGLYERTHGYTFEVGSLKDKYASISYPLQLREKGYYTGFYGKSGVNYDGFKNLFDDADCYDRKDNFADKRGYNYKTIDGDTVHLTEYTGYQAREFIKKAPKDKPFCLSLSFSAPHAHDPAKEQYFWQTKSENRYEDVDIPEPLLKEDHYFLSQPKDVQYGFNRLRWWWRYDTPEKYQYSLKGYYRMITEIDDEIGEIRRLLEEKGLADNTVIIFLGDNGLFLGERQMAGKWLMYEQSIRVPLIIYDPRTNCHRDIDDMVLNIDVTRTILDYAGASVPEQYQGISLKNYESAEREPEARNCILIEHLWKKKEIPSSEGVRTKKWKYFRYRFLNDSEELYDLQLDPMETRNLAKSNAYKVVLDSMRNLCDEKIKELSGF